MKKIVLLLIAALFCLSGALYSVGSDKQVDDEYDEDTYGPQDPIIWTMPVKSVVFEHKVHTMGAELECDSCHDDVFEMEAGVAEENEDFTMATLYDGGYCGSCHDGSTAFASNTRCTACHIGVRGHARLQGEGDSANAHH